MQKYVAVLALTSLVLIAHQATAHERPNIVLIMCDDLGYADVGFNGSTDIQTPNLDQLANAGTIFTSAYVAHPFCGPSRLGLMTGRYPHTMGGQFNLPERGDGIGKEEGIPTSETLISTVLQSSGYRTGLVGKWHLGEMPEFHPNKRGFDDFYGFLGGGHCYHPEQYQAEYNKRIKNGLKNIWSYYAPLEHNGKSVTEDEYLTDELSHQGVRFIQESSKTDKPFFLYLSYNAPHTPLEAKPEDLAKFASIKDEKRRTYAAMVYAVDRGVEEVVGALKETGEYENTLIVFLSDNGGRTDQGANNAPLRGTKGDVLEGGFRVPMFFHWPDHVVSGQRFVFPVSALDFYPTFVGLAEANVPAQKVLDGKNIWNAFQSGKNPHRGELIYALRHRPPNNEIAAIDENWKLSRFGNGSWKLFNLTEDIREQNDLSSEYPGRVNSMVAEVKAWSSTHTPPKWFDSVSIRDKWIEHQMPHFDTTFPSADSVSNNAP